MPLLHLNFSYFTITGPSFIQSNSKYSVAVLSDATIPTSILLTIQNDKGFSASESVTVQAQSSQTVDFSVSQRYILIKLVSKIITKKFVQFGSLDGGDYKFTATGQNGFNFVNETTLTFQTKHKSVFIQSNVQARG